MTERGRAAPRYAQRFGLLALLAATCWATAWLLLFTTPQGWRLVLGLALARAPVAVTLGDVELSEDSRPFAPTSWRLAFVDVRVLPEDPYKPEVWADRVIVEGWRPRALLRRELSFAEARVVGLRVGKRRQRPAPDWVPQRGVLAAVAADRVEVWDAAYRADADPPLPRVEVRGIYGEIEDVRFDPRFREVSGTAIARAAAFAVGTLDLSRLVATELTAERSSLALRGQARFGGSPVRFHGRVEEFHRRARVSLNATLEGASLAGVVRAATERDSPLDGTLEADLVLTSGPPLPRGGAVLEGAARLRGGRLDAEAEPKPFVRELLWLGAWVDLDEDRRLILGDLEGRIRIRRGVVELEDLVYETEHRTLQIRGTMDEARGVALLLWQRPRGGLPPLGLVVTGQPGALSVRVARRAEFPGEERN